MIIFLDIDGVLHSYGERIANQFCYLPRLESVLRDFPFVQIVISSNWRKHDDLVVLRTFFSADIGLRVIGVTPDLSGRIDCREQGGIRHHEALAWMWANDYTGSWLALDDDPHNWLPGDPLVFCDDGFTESEEQALRTTLAAIYIDKIISVQT